MNTDLILSNLRSLLKIAGASAVTHGYMTNGKAEFWAGLIFAVIGYLCSHATHKEDGSPAAKQGTLFGLILLCVVVGSPMGCTTSAAYKTEKATAVTVEKAMAGWNDYVGQFHPSQAAEMKVKSAFEKYRVAELVAIDATAAYAAEKTDAKKTTMQAAAAAVAASLTDLVAVIQTFGVKL
ncbi:MAG: hypothetical protein ACXWKG_19035 [Limisphaerales bacterium]